MTAYPRIPLFGRLLGAVLMLLMTLPGSPSAQPGTAPTGDPGGFGIDGDLDPGTPGLGTTDWMSLIMPNGTPTSPDTWHGVDAYDNFDPAFRGSRLFDNPNTNWFWDNDAMTNPLGGRENFSNGVAHFSIDGQGHTWFTWAVDRQGNGSESYMDVGLYQNTLVINSNGTFSSAGPNGGHTVGDLVLSLTIASQATSPPVLTVWRWSEVGPGVYDFTSLTPAAGTVFTATNTGPANVAYLAFGNGHYGPAMFAEASIDLSALLGAPHPAASFRTMLFHSRFGPPIASVLMDFIDPIQFQFLVDVEMPRPAGATRIVNIAPNPARGAVSVEFEIAQAGLVSLDFFDVAGRRVGSVVRASLPAGRHALRWDPTNRPGRERAGVLYARLASEAGTDVRRLIVMP